MVAKKAVTPSVTLDRQLMINDIEFFIEQTEDTGNFLMANFGGHYYMIRDLDIEQFAEITREDIEDAMECRRINVEDEVAGSFNWPYGWLFEGVTDEQIEQSSPDDVNDYLYRIAFDRYHTMPEDCLIRKTLTYDQWLALSDFADMKQFAIEKYCAINGFDSWPGVWMEDR